MVNVDVLVEGLSDIPGIKIILSRRFGHLNDVRFNIIPHRGKGKLPPDPHAPPEPRRFGLLDVLPVKLRAYANLPELRVMVLLDADDEDCMALKRSLNDMHAALGKRPRLVLFRIACEEIESWWLADRAAVRRAYPEINLRKLPLRPPDTFFGSWEALARALGRNPNLVDGGDKSEWAEKIAPLIDIDPPKSPSLNAFITGIERLIKDEGF